MTPAPAVYTRSTADVAGGLARQLRAFGRRVGQGDPAELDHLVALRAELDDVFATAVAGLRTAGYSDGAIGRQLGVTGQAVNKRWPRPRVCQCGVELALCAHTRCDMGD